MAHAVQLKEYLYQQQHDLPSCLCEQFTDLNTSSHSCSKLLLTLQRRVLQQTCVSMTSPHSISPTLQRFCNMSTTNFCTGNVHHYSFSGGMWWCNWLMHCVTCQVMYLILNYVIGFLLWHNPTGHVMVWGRLNLSHKWVPGIFSWTGQGSHA